MTACVCEKCCVLYFLFCYVQVVLRWSCIEWTWFLWPSPTSSTHQDRIGKHQSICRSLKHRIPQVFDSSGTRQWAFRSVDCIGLVVSGKPLHP